MFLVTSIEEPDHGAAPGHTGEIIYVSAGLGTLQDHPKGALESGWGEECGGFSSETVGPTTQTLTGSRGRDKTTKKYTISDLFIVTRLSICLITDNVNNDNTTQCAVSSSPSNGSR